MTVEAHLRGVSNFVRPIVLTLTLFPFCAFKTLKICSVSALVGSAIADCGL